MGVLNMLVFKKDDLEIYTTNNLLLVLKNDVIIKNISFKDSDILDDLILETREKLFARDVKVNNI